MNEVNRMPSRWAIVSWAWSLRVELLVAVTCGAAAFVLWLVAFALGLSILKALMP